MCEMVGNILRLRRRVMVNFLGYGCLCSNLSVAEDTLHHPEPEEGVIASCRWGWTHHSFLKGEEDTS